MKQTLLILLTLLFGVFQAQADTLLPYIEQPINIKNVVVFSAGGITYKNCLACEEIKLTPDSAVEYLENGQPIDLSRATELYVSKQYGALSVFYTRSTGVYNQISFGSFEGFIVQQAQQKKLQAERGKK